MHSYVFFYRIFFTIYFSSYICKYMKACLAFKMSNTVFLKYNERTPEYPEASEKKIRKIFIAYYVLGVVYYVTYDAIGACR